MSRTLSSMCRNVTNSMYLDMTTTLYESIIVYHKLYMSRHVTNSMYLDITTTLYESIIVYHKLYMSRNVTYSMYLDITKTLYEYIIMYRKLYMSRNVTNSVYLDITNFTWVNHYETRTLHESKCHEPYVSTYHYTSPWVYRWIPTNSTWVEMPRTLCIYISPHLSVSLSLNSHELYMSRNVTNLTYLHITTPLRETIIEFSRTLITTCVKVNGKETNSFSLVKTPRIA